MNRRPSRGSRSQLRERVKSHAPRKSSLTSAISLITWLVKRRKNHEHSLCTTRQRSRCGAGAIPGERELRGIQIGLNVITRVARVRTERERSAMIWLHNYARLENLTADALSDELDLSKPDIRAALTDPEADWRGSLGKWKNCGKI
jgi:hypothetical protein